MSDALALEERFLDGLRRRVSWQSEQAAKQRAEATAPPVTDVLDPQALAALIESRPDDVRAPERRAFLAELTGLTEEDGRLPASLERLVRHVFVDLL